MNPKENIKSKKLIRCSACGNPVAEVDGHNIYLLKYQNGKTTRTKVTVKHDSGGRFEISCGCGGSTFSTVQKTLSMTYVIAKPKTSESLTPKTEVI